MALWTFKDQIKDLRDSFGNRTEGDIEQSKIKRSIFSALRDLAGRRRWRYFTRFLTATVNASYSTGTIAYTHSSRTVTLTSGTFPSWAGLGYIVISNVPYKVASRTSSSAIVLSVNSNPGANVSSGTTYLLFQDALVLPANLEAIDSVLSQTSKFRLSYLEPYNFALRERTFVTPGSCAFYTITGDPNYQGRNCLRVSPPPSDAQSLEILGYYAPLEPLLDQYITGTAAVTSGSTTVMGTGTSWDSSMVNACFRLGQDGTNIPTGPDGYYRFAAERVITAVNSATELVVDTAFTETASGRKYAISDILDVDPLTMLNALRAGCKYQYGAVELGMATRKQLEQDYDRELLLAMEADGRKQVERDGVGEMPGRRWKYVAPYETGP